MQQNPQSQMLLPTHLVIRNGTHLEMWTFVELHGQHYGKMAEVWNEEHPDQTIEITCTTYPYADMHTKLYRTSGRNWCTGHL